MPTPQLYAVLKGLIKDDCPSLDGGHRPQCQLDSAETPSHYPEPEYPQTAEL
ncbi:MAG: hypothetical protein V8T87_13775 [Victivallales bacterium]